MKRCVGSLRLCNKLPWNLVAWAVSVLSPILTRSPTGSWWGLQPCHGSGQAGGLPPRLPLLPAVAGGLSSLPHGPLHRQLMAAGCPRMRDLRETEPPETTLCFHALIWEWQPALLLDPCSRTPRLPQCVRCSTEVWERSLGAPWGAAATRSDTSLGFSGFNCT